MKEGDKIETGTHSSGKKTGIWKIISQNKKEHGSFVQNLKEGPWIEMENKVESRGNYKNGMKTGVWEIKGENGLHH